MLSWYRTRLILEMGALYLAAPAAVYYLVYTGGVPLLALLPFVLPVLIAILFLGQDATWQEAFTRPVAGRDLAAIALTFAVCGSALIGYAYAAFPQHFLAFPKNAPRLWWKVMVFYPLISVTIQELLYRVLYFHRYAPLFGARIDVAIAVNGLLFAFMHAILFAYRSSPFHWEAVVIGFAGGLLFAYRFSRTRSFWAVALEHALYGDLIFTAGLGVFFFTGVANL